MRAALCGRNLDHIKPLLAAYDIELVDEDPDVVISYGGDGALLGAERKWPGIVKCPIRDSGTNPKCSHHAEENIVQLLAEGKLAKSCVEKLDAVKDGDHDSLIRGLNDIVVNKQIISSGVRYRLQLDGKPYAHNIVGDGLIVSTPFGSTGYYRSITHSLFHLGIGIAFNNSTEPLDHLVVKDTTEINVEIIRGPAVLIADNDPHSIPLAKGNCVTIRRSGKSACVLGLEQFRCDECARYRQKNHAAI